MFHRYLAVAVVALAPSLASAQGLTAAAAEQAARAHLDRNQSRYGVTSADLDLAVNKAYTSQGMSHVFFRQRLNGIETIGTEVGIHFDRNGHVFHETGRLLHNLASRAGAAAPALTPAAAAEVVARDAGLVPTSPFAVVERKDAAGHDVVLSDGGVALAPPTATLYYVLDEADRAQLAWAVSLYQNDAQHLWYTYVDAVSGDVISRSDLVIHDDFGPSVGAQLAESARTVGPWLFEAPSEYAPTSAMVGSYRVYQMPVESPNHTAPLPPADGRTLVANPDVAGGIASPFGWHDTNGAAGAEFTTSQGNNVFAYADADANNSPDAGVPDGGAGLLFDFPLPLGSAPSAYRPAAITNLFYWNNILHDVYYQYGFDEASGNFQTNNYGRGGAGADHVLAEAQDGSGTNNANFSTPTDGSSGRMQMFIWTSPTPDKDGDVDNGIILHEYTHGISNRLTGNAVTCLGNAEQMGEGWSDYTSVMFTWSAGDTRTTNRGVGTYALDQPVAGPGIRPAPYNTNFAVNDFTYQDTRTQVAPHGVGFVWATILWEVTWDMIDAHGFSPNLYDASGTAGNQIMLNLVTNGMKLQPCSPGFVDGRDAIIAADVALYGGVHVDELWEGFARRGLGFSASQGSTSSNADNTEAFNTPEFVPPAPVTDLAVTPQGDFATLLFTATGDDGSVGTATTYDARYATGAGCPITTDGAFLAATQATGEPAPHVAGTAEQVEVHGLSFTTAYCFALKVADENGNLSTLSNPVSTTTLGPPVITPPAANPITASVPSGGTTTVPVTIGNTGASTLTYSVDLVETLLLTPAPGDAATGTEAGSEAAFAPTEAELKNAPETPGTANNLGSGGPDAFGYRWIDSDEPGGPVFSWVDIAATGTAVTLTDDDHEVVTLPFTFDFYGTPFTSVSIGSNGYLSFGTTGLDDFTNDPIPNTATPNNLVGPFWDDLNPAVGGQIFYRNMGDGRFVVQYEAVPHFGGGGTYTFEIILHSSGAMYYQYETMVGNITSATIGVENATGTDGLQVVFNAAYMHDGLAVRISSLWVDASVSTPTVPAGGTDSFDLNFDAGGLANGTYNANMTIASNDPATPSVVVPIVFTVGPVAIEPGTPAFEGTHLLTAVRPNPVVDQASFTLAVRDAGPVTVALFDALGRRVATVFEGQMAAGAARSLAVNGAGLASGTYVLRVEGTGFAESRRITLLR